MIAEQHRMIRVELGKEVLPGVWAYTIAGTALEGRSHEPLLDACRQIKRMGTHCRRDQVGLYRRGRGEPDLVCGLDWGAAHTVREDGLRFVPFRAGPASR
jgi:hypothetical protein